MYVIDISFLKVKIQARKSERSLTGGGLVRGRTAGEKAQGREVGRAEYSLAILGT